MPNHRSHTMLGSALWLVLVVILALIYPNDLRTLAKVALVGFVFTYLGSILPDIDEKHSNIFKQTRFLIFVIFFILSYSTLFGSYSKETLEQMMYILVICSLTGAAAVLFFYAIMPAHRGRVHSISAAGLYALFCVVCSYLILPNIAFAILIALFGFLGYFSHLLLDRSVK